MTIASTILRELITLVLAFGAFSIGGCSSPSQGFASPEAAADAMATALRHDDRASLQSMLGPDADDLLSSGDAVADHEACKEFLAAYDLRHRVVATDDSATILAGEDEWPMPIPLIRSGDAWRFDVERGRDEIIARRVGRNELDAMETCRAIVDAQQEFRSQTGQYAVKFLSDPGSRNGLYWPTVAGEAQSPLGPLVAEAATEGYNLSQPASGPRPYHGYCYRVLTTAGPAAPGGRRDYLADGRLQTGFAILAYPIEYGDSGIMTFMVCHNGVLYERDLGPNTAQTATAMPSFNPDANWRAVPEEPIAR